MCFFFAVDMSITLKSSWVCSRQNSNVIQSSKTSKRNQPAALLSGTSQMTVIPSLILPLFKLSLHLVHPLYWKFTVESNQMYVIEFEDWKKNKKKNHHKSIHWMVCNNPIWIFIKFDYFLCHSKLFFSWDSFIRIITFFCCQRFWCTFQIFSEKHQKKTPKTTPDNTKFDLRMIKDTHKFVFSSSLDLLCKRKVGLFFSAFRELSIEEKYLL